MLTALRYRLAMWIMPREITPILGGRQWYRSDTDKLRMRVSGPLLTTLTLDEFGIEREKRRDDEP